MKLYGTLTSERASKGQGGNKMLDTLYTIGESRAPFMAVKMTVQGESETVLVQIHDYRKDSIVLENVLDLREYKGK